MPWRGEEVRRGEAQECPGSVVGTCTLEWARCLKDLHRAGLDGRSLLQHGRQHADGATSFYGAPSWRARAWVGGLADQVMMSVTIMTDRTSFNAPAAPAAPRTPSAPASLLWRGSA